MNVTSLLLEIAMDGVQDVTQSEIRRGLGSIALQHHLPNTGVCGDGDPQQAECGRRAASCDRWFHGLLPSRFCVADLRVISRAVMPLCSRLSVNSNPMTIRS